jgi:preprotein translocase subunit SecD
VRLFRSWHWLVVIVVFTAVAATLLVQDIKINNFVRDGFELGLDLEGGSHLVFQSERENPTDTQMEGVMNVIRRRVDSFGVTEPLIQRMGEDRVLVQLPGVTDVDEAEALIGKTAQLEFKQRDCDDANCDTFTDSEIGLTGENLTDAFVSTDPTAGYPIINLRFDSQGATIFGEVTGGIAGTNNRLAIFLDDEELIAPTAQRAILTGQAVIFRNNPPFSIEQAELITVQLEAGRLPVPLIAIERRTVDATLGADALEKSRVAGILGGLLVALFMVLYYRVPGLLAAIALALYVALVLALFKLIPVTLTLAGVAAFVLSIGMAVDANILIFERMREELRTGRSMRAAVDVGFNRAWPAIRDSNLSTFIIVGVLWWFGDRLGASLVQGFAVTLFIGVAASMFSAIFVTRTFLRLAASTPLAKRLVLFIPATAKAQTKNRSS